MNHLKQSNITNPMEIIISILEQHTDKQLNDLVDTYVNIIAYSKEGDANKVCEEIKQRASNLLDLQFNK